MATRARRGPAVAVVVSLVAALAGGAWFVLSESRPAGSVALDRAPTSTSASSSTSFPEPVTAPPVSAATEHEEPREVAKARREEELPSVPSDRLLVIVRRAADHDPIAGAQVAWANQDELAREREWRGGDETYVDENELVEEVGEHGETDARGLLFVPCDRNARLQPSLVICAKHEALWGLVTLPSRREPMPAVVTIDLMADDAIRVQVVDAGGTPQPGLVVAFGIKGANVGRQSRRARTEGPDAIATIRGVTAFARLFSESERVEWGVTALVPLREPAFVAIDRQALPKEPMVIRLPRCARMVLSFVDADGAAVLRTARVVLNALPPLDPGDPPPPRRCLLSQKLVGRDGALEIPFVDLGLEFEVRVEVDRVGVFYEFMKGPDAAGETLARTLVLEFGRIAFTGTILHQDDAPLANERVTVRVLANRGGDVRPFELPCVGEGETDEKGAFSIEVAVAGRHGSFDCELLVHSATGPEFTLNAVAVSGEKKGAARLGTLRLPGN
jgi:hypothetical protein